MNQRLIQAVLAGLVAAAPSFAQTASSGASNPPSIGAGLDAVQSELANWRSQHGESWQMVFDKEVGYARFIYSGSVAPAFAPKNDADFFALGRYWMNQTQSMHGVNTQNLIEDSVTFLPLSLAGTTDKYTVQFRQAKNGVPALDGYANVLFDANGRLLAIDTTAARGIDALSTTPALSAQRASQLAQTWFANDSGLEATFVSQPKLMIDQAEQGDQRVATLSWEVNVQFDNGSGVADGYIYRVDAHTGSQSSRVKSVHQFDVSGTVQSKASPGAFPDEASNPTQSLAMPYLAVTSASGNAKTDNAGNFNIVGASAPLSATFKYQGGTFATVNNNAGAAYTLTTSLTAPTGNAVLMNNPAAALVTAQANALLWIGKMRDWIRGVNPSDATGDFLHTANVNQSSTCNAFYNGTSTNFFQAGGGCTNTAYSSVVLHENGHWMNDKYSSGNGPDGFGEGNADNWSTYILDDPIVGHDFCGNGCNVRNANNNRQFCGDCCGGCYGEVHNDGEVLMGACWKVRTRLKTSLGSSAGSQVANLLFLGWMESFNDTQIKTIIETHWLTLDDNDGNTGNGTPHYADIDGGFKQQGFPGFNLTFVAFTNVTQLSDSTSIGPFTVNADVTAPINPPVNSVNLLYNVNNGAFQTVPMTLTTGNTWTAQIPALTSCPDTVKYYLSGMDSALQVGTFPTNAPTSTLSFKVLFNSPSNYCVGKLNSIGTVPSIDAIGSPTLSANNLVIELQFGTIGKSALVFWGTQSAALPFDGGTLCVKPPLTRGPIRVTDSFGYAANPFPISASDVGKTYFFQWWMRDPADPFTDGLSDGLKVQICN